MDLEVGPPTVGNGFTAEQVRDGLGNTHAGLSMVVSSHRCRETTASWGQFIPSAYMFSWLFMLDGMLLWSMIEREPLTIIITHWMMVKSCLNNNCESMVNDALIMVYDAQIMQENGWWWLVMVYSTLGHITLSATRPLKDQEAHLLLCACGTCPDASLRSAGSADGGLLWSVHSGG